MGAPFCRPHSYTQFLQNYHIYNTITFLLTDTISVVFTLIVRLSTYQVRLSTSIFTSIYTFASRKKYHLLFNY